MIIPWPRRLTHPGVLGTGSRSDGNCENQLPTLSLHRNLLPVIAGDSYTGRRRSIKQSTIVSWMMSRMAAWMQACVRMKDLGSLVVMFRQTVSFVVKSVFLTMSADRAFQTGILPQRTTTFCVTGTKPTSTILARTYSPGPRCTFGANAEVPPAPHHSVRSPLPIAPSQEPST